MGSEKSADQAWDFLSSWFVIWVRFYRAGGRFPRWIFAFLFVGRVICAFTAWVRLLTFTAIDFATRLSWL
jgi:hypothetical protein